MTRMLTVYSLREEDQKDPEMLRQTQKLSSDRSKPHMGLSDRLGLYGTDDWWRNVESGKIPRVHHAGLITETFYSGMDSDRRHNSFWMKTDDGRDFWYSMIPEGSTHKGLYRPGHRAEITTIYVELKRQTPDGKPELLEMPLEVRLSTTPVTTGSIT